MLVGGCSFDRKFRSNPHLVPVFSSELGYRGGYLLSSSVTTQKPWFVSFPQHLISTFPRLVSLSVGSNPWRYLLPWQLDCGMFCTASVVSSVFSGWTVAVSLKTTITFHASATSTWATSSTTLVTPVLQHHHCDSVKPASSCVFGFLYSAQFL